MKKLILILFTAMILPVAAFADVGGGDLRFKRGSFQAEALLLYAAGADLMLGPISVGVAYIMALNLDNGISLKTGSGLPGMNVLFRM